MKRKIVESILEGLRGFTKPSVVLEQYPTPAHLAADVMHFADEGFDDVQDKVVLDLGCGCGMLSIAAAVKGAEIVIGVDVDQEALQVFEDNRENVQDMCDIGTTLSLSLSLFIDPYTAPPPSEFMDTRREICASLPIHFSEMREASIPHMSFELLKRNGDHIEREETSSCRRRFDNS